MQTAKDILVKPITPQSANAIIKKFHYSGKVVHNSQLHLGVFINDKCEGAMQFGPCMAKKNMLKLVTGTKWNGFIELNRMAFGPKLPKNSESRAIAVALRMIKKNYPHIEWVISFADGTQCGDGTIYRASGFSLIGIKKNTELKRLVDGSVVCAMTYGKGKHILETGRSTVLKGAVSLPGYQLKYIYFLSNTARERLAVPVIPFSQIKELGAGMYLGKQRAHEAKVPRRPSTTRKKGGASPTHALHKPARQVKSRSKYA